MAVNACDICGCIPISMDDRFFYQAAVNLLCNISTASGSGTTSLGKVEDTAHASGDVGVQILAVRNDAKATLTSTDGDYSPIGVGTVGNVFASLWYDSTIGASSPVRLEDSALAGGHGLMVMGAQRQDIPTNDTSTDGDAAFIKSNAEGCLYVDTVRRNTMTHTQPSVTTATSFTLVAANAQRKYLRVQNNSAANILLNLNNGTLTGIAPTSTNLGIVLAAGAFFETPPNFCPTAAVTVYQSSGGTINTISVIEGA